MALDEEKPKRERAPMAPETYHEIRRRLAVGHLQHDIAADLGINQGRVSEVNTGKRGSDMRQMPLL
jgi:hypothetical protein